MDSKELSVEIPNQVYSGGGNSEEVERVLLDFRRKGSRNRVLSIHERRMESVSEVCDITRNNWTEKRSVQTLNEFPSLVQKK